MCIASVMCERAASLRSAMFRRKRWNAAASDDAVVSTPSRRCCSSSRLGFAKALRPIINHQFFSRRYLDASTADWEAAVVGYVSVCKLLHPLILCARKTSALAGRSVSNRKHARRITYQLHCRSTCQTSLLGASFDPKPRGTGRSIGHYALHMGTSAAGTYRT